jgi:hypothetical protein
MIFFIALSEYSMFAFPPRKYPPIIRQSSTMIGPCLDRLEKGYFVGSLIRIGLSVYPN